MTPIDITTIEQGQRLRVLASHDKTLLAVASIRDQLCRCCDRPRHRFARLLTVSGQSARLVRQACRTLVDELEDYAGWDAATLQVEASEGDVVVQRVLRRGGWRAVGVLRGKRLWVAFRREG